MTTSVRHLLLLLTLLGLCLGPVGCGPSSTQIKAARSARYQADRSVILDAVVEAVRADYRLQLVDTDAGIVETVERWYEEDGTFAQLRAQAHGRAVNDRSIKLNYRIALVVEAGKIEVQVTPLAAQKRSGYAALFPFHPGAPDLPGWIQGKTDLLQVAIHDRLRTYAAPAPAP